MAIQTPAVVDFTIYKGSYFTRTITYKKGTPAIPVDLSGYTVRAQIRTNYNVSPKLADFVISPSSNLAQGEIILELYADTSALIEANKGVWDLEIIPATGEHYASRLAMGNVVFSREVTTEAP